MGQTDRAHQRPQRLALQLNEALSGHLDLSATGHGVRQRLRHLHRRVCSLLVQCATLLVLLLLLLRQGPPARAVFAARRRLYASRGGGWGGVAFGEAMQTGGAGRSVIGGAAAGRNGRRAHCRACAIGAARATVDRWRLRRGLGFTGRACIVG